MICKMMIRRRLDDIETPMWLGKKIHSVALPKTMQGVPEENGQRMDMVGHKGAILVSAGLVHFYIVCKYF